MKTVILCGSKGTRMREETEFRPKPLVNVGENPIIWHIMKIYSHYGIHDFILCVGYKGDMIKRYFMEMCWRNNDFTVTTGTKADVIYHTTDEGNWNVTIVDTGAETQTGGRIKRIERYINEDDFMLTYTKNNLAQRNLSLFYSKFGVHPWQASFIDFNVINLLEYDGQSDRSILGIGMSCGSTLLQIKNMCRSKGGRNIRIFYLSGQEGNMTELRSVCETCVHAGTGELLHWFGEKLYDYIVVETETDKLGNIQSVFQNLGSLLKEGGQLVCTAANEELAKLIQSSLAKEGLTLTKSHQNYYFCFTKSCMKD